MTRSKYPSSSSEDVGVYALMTSSSLTLQCDTGITTFRKGHCNKQSQGTLPKLPEKPRIRRNMCSPQAINATPDQNMDTMGLGKSISACRNSGVAAGVGEPHLA